MKSQLIQASGRNSIPREGHLSRAELNIELRGPGFESTEKSVITYDHKIKIKKIKSFSVNSITTGAKTCLRASTTCLCTKHGW